MSEDKREAILVRLYAIIGGIAGVKTAARNEIEFDDTQLPAMGLLEGDEEAKVDESSKPGSASVIVTATPQVFIRCGAVPASIGTELNTLRARLIKAVLTDANLHQLVGPNGRIRYAGMQSHLHAARTMMGAMIPVFAITYVLRPDRL